MEDYYERREREREERREYEGDAMYQVWRQGGNVDRIDYERVDDHRRSGESADAAARAEMNRQRPKQNEYEPEPYEYEPQYPEPPEPTPEATA